MRSSVTRGVLGILRPAVGPAVAVLHLASVAAGGGDRPRTPESAGSRTGKTVLRHGGHVYVVVPRPETWTRAARLARQAGGRLAIIDSADENRFLFTRLTALGIATRAPDGGGAVYVWLGASDAEKEGDWKWVDGRRLADGYTRWGKGPLGKEPDNFRGRQDYLALGLTGWPAGRPGGLGSPSQWNDLDGENHLAWVVEFDDPTRDTNADGVPDWKTFAASP